MGKKTDYSKKLNPVYIESMEANQIYINNRVEQTGQRTEYKVGNRWMEWQKIKTNKAVLTDSLFLRYMAGSITRKCGDICDDFIVVKFSYDAEYRDDKTEEKVSKYDLRKKYYTQGVVYMSENINKKGEAVGGIPAHYKMLMRSPGKAKSGECIFIRDNLYHMAIKFLTMGLYDVMQERAKNDPERFFNLVELSAYQTLTTATAKGYIRIPLEDILIVKDEKVVSDGMSAAIVKLEERAEKGLMTGESLGKECTVIRVPDARIGNILHDGMGLIDKSIFPQDMDGFIYCRSHFFKSCLFCGDIQKFFGDYCKGHGLDYDTYITDTDMFGRKIRLKDIKVVITDKSLKWLYKFVDIMGGTEKKAYRYYRNYMKKFDDYFSIVKTSHPSKFGDLQLMTYQMNNSLPTTDKEVLGRICECGVNFCNGLKGSDLAYLDYLEGNKNNFNVNELLVELTKWNPDFMKTEFFRKKKSSDISGLLKKFREGRMPQNGDNLTIMDNPLALLLKAAGDKWPLNEGCFEILRDGVQCYTPRFGEGERLAAFRSPHNSPNNILHLYNVYPEKLTTYFPDIGRNVIVFNGIKTDTQARLSGHDCDSDFVYVTNQDDIVALAGKAYTEYPTIINCVEEHGINHYHLTLEDYAEMDNQIAKAQEAIGMSTDTAQIALSYYYDGGMESRELEDCFIILSVIGQISIDLAKKCFDIDVVREINRVRNRPCMKRNDIPRFFADNKKSRNNKIYEDDRVMAMNCPMDIMAEIIKNEVVGYAEREFHLPLRNFWNAAAIGRENRYKKDKFIKESNIYMKADKWLEAHKTEMDDNVFFSLKSRNMARFMGKVSKELDQETVMKLVIYATDDNNSDVCATILNFLFRRHRSKFMNCFVKKGPQQGETLA